MKRIVSFLMLLPIMVGVSVFTTSCSDDDQRIAFDIITPADAPADAPAGVKGAVKFSAINDPVTPQSANINVLTAAAFTLEFEDAEVDRWYAVTAPAEGNSIDKGVLTITVNDYLGIDNPDRSAIVTVVAADGRTVKFMIMQEHESEEIVPINPDAEYLRGNYSGKGDPVFENNPTEWTTAVYQMTEGGVLIQEIAIDMWGNTNFDIFPIYIQLEVDDKGKMTPWIRTRLFPVADEVTYTGAMIAVKPYALVDVEGKWDPMTKTITFPAKPPASNILFGIMAVDGASAPTGSIYGNAYFSFELKLTSRDDTFIAAKDDNGVAIRPSPPAGVSVSKAPQMALQLKEIMK